MEDTIKKIIEMDKAARNITENAEKKRAESLLEIEKNCETVKAEYLEKARHRLSLNNKAEREAAAKRWLQREELLNKNEQKLIEKYEENCDLWVKTLVERVKSGE